jgi:ABC-type phosphate transport system substrate-binding protein
MKIRSFAATALLSVAASIAHAEVVVIVNPAATAPGKEEVADIFLGKSRSFTPVDQPDGSPLYADFYKKATGRDVAQVKAMWSRIVFSGKGQAPRQLGDSVAVRKAVAADPKAIGYVDKSAVDGSVKAVLTLD